MTYRDRHNKVIPCAACGKDSDGEPSLTAREIGVYPCKSCESIVNSWEYEGFMYNLDMQRVINGYTN